MVPSHFFLHIQGLQGSKDLDTAPVKVHSHNQALKDVQAGERTHSQGHEAEMEHTVLAPGGVLAEERRTGLDPGCRTELAVGQVAGNEGWAGPFSPVR